MLRQRIRARSNAFGGLIGRILVALIALMLVWYGLMLVLLSLKVAPEAVNTISGYRSVFASLARLQPADIDSTNRLISGVAGIFVLVVFAYLAWRALPRPYLARHDLTLDGEIGRELVVEARAIERIAEIAARDLGRVSSARARAGAERIEVDVGLCDASNLGSDLTTVQGRVLDALEQHELPRRPVDVTLVGFERAKARQLL